MKNAQILVGFLAVLSFLAYENGSNLIAAVLFAGVAIAGTYLLIQMEKQEAETEKEELRQSNEEFDAKQKRDKVAYFHKHGVPKHNDTLRVEAFAVQNKMTVTEAEDRLIDFEILAERDEEKARTS